MKYGTTSDRWDGYLFDAIDTAERRFLDWDEFVALARDLDLPVVPVLYRGPFRGVTAAFADGPTSIAKAGGHRREGFVVHPVKEAFDPRIEGQRVILKLHGEKALLAAG
jgi:hypothetical protein